MKKTLLLLLWLCVSSCAATFWAEQEEYYPRGYYWNDPYWGWGWRSPYWVPQPRTRVIIHSRPSAPVTPPKESPTPRHRKQEVPRLFSPGPRGTYVPERGSGFSTPPAHRPVERGSSPIRTFPRSNNYNR